MEPVQSNAQSPNRPDPGGASRVEETAEVTAGGVAARVGGDTLLYALHRESQPADALAALLEDGAVPATVSAATEGEDRVVRMLAFEQQRREQDARGREVMEWFWFAYVAFFLASLPLMLVGGLGVFVRMVVAGCLTGMSWQVVPHTKRACSASALLVFVSVVVLPGLDQLWADPLAGGAAMFGAALVAWFGGIAVRHLESGAGRVG